MCARLTVLVLFGLPGSALAQVSTPNIEPSELRALAEAERELFLQDTPVSEPAGSEFVNDVPAILTARLAVPAEPESPATDSIRWLDGIVRPSLPLRWDDRIVRYLELWRSDERGQRVLGALLRRAQRWAPMIRAELQAQGLPEDLLYVAMVESGFDPAARSPAGAVGLWQFTTATGQYYGLRYDHWVDERRDPEKSTRAAARCLRALRDEFGSWELALAAYNMGGNGLVRAIRKYNTNDYWLLAELEAGLPHETTLYVAKILASAVAAHNTARFGVGAIALDPPLDVVSVDVRGGVLLAEIARAAGVAPSTVEGLNLDLRRKRTPPGEALWTVRIPAAAAARFSERWPRRGSNSSRYRSHVVRFGETLEDIAHLYRTTTASLRSVNVLDAAERVRTGVDLLVPAVEPAPSTGDLPVVAVSDPSIEVAGQRRIFYRVIEGDTLSEIGAFFDLEPDAIRGWNHIDTAASLQAGMFLQLWVDPSRDLSRALVLTPDDVHILAVGSEEFFEHHESQRGRIRVRHRVREGDTLASIARQFGLTAGSLARINRRRARAELAIGEEIIVYAPRGAEESTNAPEAAADATEPPAPAAPAPADTGQTAPVPAIMRDTSQTDGPPPGTD